MGENYIKVLIILVFSDIRSGIVQNRLDMADLEKIIKYPAAEFHKFEVNSNFRSSTLM